ncbi:MAG: hypothetical protein R2744_11470, partial [Bacteroidales bacterium]
MNRPILAILLIALATAVNAQVPDAISGATLKPEYLLKYLDDPETRAIYNSDPYDNQPETMLEGAIFTVQGEILNPGVPSIDGLHLREVVVKELLPSENNGEPVFMGAFRYTGYSLPDLLRDFVIDKVNREEFGLNHDLYLLVENERGESATFS